MISSKVFSRLFSASFVMTTIVAASSVYATISQVVLDLEGNPTCSSLVENSIFELRDTSPPEVGVEGELTLHNGQKLKYTINPDDTVTSWHLVAPGADFPPPVYPVNFVILKGAGNAGARVFHYGQQGVPSDTDLEGPGTLKTVSFCYGLNDEVIVEAKTLPHCDDTDFELEGIEIDCDLVSDKGVSFQSVKKGPTLTYSLCTCNKTATVCDRSLPAGTIGACIAKCPSDSDPEGYPYTFDEVEYLSEVECLQDNALNETPNGGTSHWNNGSGWCSTGGGSNTCYTW